MTTQLHGIRDSRGKGSTVHSVYYQTVNNGLSPARERCRISSLSRPRTARDAPSKPSPLRMQIVAKRNHDCNVAYHAQAVI